MKSKDILDYGPAFKKVLEQSTINVANAFALTTNEVGIIYYLYRYPEACSSDIIRDLLFSKSHVSLSVNSLEEKGYVEATKDSKDKKVLHLKLTQKCDDIVEMIKKEREFYDQKLFENVSEEDKKTFIDVLFQMLENMEVYAEEL